MGNAVGKVLQIGTHRVKIGKVIAEGGFSYLHVAYDVDSGKAFALKRSICQDADSLNQATTEMSIMVRQPPTTPVFPTFSTIGFVTSDCIAGSPKLGALLRLNSHSQLG
jgi:hypothetical protein